MLQFKKARQADAEALAQISERAFHSDIHCGAPSLGGPPGYNEANWQVMMMRRHDYYKIIKNGQIVGGIIVIYHKPREYELGRIFVDPTFQNQGIGTEAMAFLWDAYPLAKCWTLGTPAWNKRTRHFYRKVGFTEVSESDEIRFERRIGMVQALE